MMLKGQFYLQILQKHLRAVTDTMGIINLFVCVGVLRPSQQRSHVEPVS